MQDQLDKQHDEAHEHAAGERSPEIGVSTHVVKVIEILAESAHSWEDAASIALRNASRSLRDITSIYVSDFQAIVRDGRVRAFRVNAKVSFVVHDEDRLEVAYGHRKGGETTMRYRNQDQGREGGYRPSRDESMPEYDDDGLHGQDRRQYRGRESYEQQTRGGEGGRSGMWDHRHIAPDNRENRDDSYRSNESEDRRGYQNIGSRQDFESGGRGRPDYYMRSREDGEPRPAFNRDRDQRSWAGPDYRDRDYGRGQGGGDEWSRRYGDDYSRSDYGSRDYGSRDYAMRESRGSNPRQGNPQGSSGYSDRIPGWQGTGYDSRSQADWQGRQGYDQGRFVNAQYDAQSGQQRRTARGPKGYRRSDDRIREDICDRLSNQYDVDASEVEVSVSNGEVTLTGSVSDRDQKFRVEHLADSVGGVNEVHNQLRVRREMGTQSSSTQTTSNQRQNPTNQTRHS